MKQCPQCKDVYIDTFDSCFRCNVKLEEAPPDAVATAAPPSEVRAEPTGPSAEAPATAPGRLDPLAPRGRSAPDRSRPLFAAGLFCIVLISLAGVPRGDLPLPHHYEFVRPASGDDGGDVQFLEDGGVVRSEERRQEMAERYAVKLPPVDFAHAMYVYTPVHGFEFKGRLPQVRGVWPDGRGLLVHVGLAEEETNQQPRDDSQFIVAAVLPRRDGPVAFGIDADAGGDEGEQVLAARARVIGDIPLMQRLLGTTWQFVIATVGVLGMIGLLFGLV